METKMNQHLFGPVKKNSRYPVEYQPLVKKDN